MPSDAPIESYVAGTSRSTTTQVLAVQTSRSQPETATPSSSPLAEGAVILVPLSLMLLWATVVFLVSDAWKLTQQRLSTIKHLHQVPCRNCQFFTNNPYLKCAVNPSTALTESAKDCSDYCPKVKESQSL